MTFRIVGRKKVPIPESSRFDRMKSEDLYLLIESSLSTATHSADAYRIAHEDHDLPLTQLQTALEDCLAATKALRRKHVVTL